MSYYQVIKPWQPEIIGVKNGLAQVELVRERFMEKENYDRYVNYYLDHSKKNNLSEFPPFEINLEYLRMKKGAKLTDFLYFAPAAGIRYLISRRVIDILLKMNLPPFKIYNAQVYKREGTEIGDYALFCTPIFDFSIVDFPSCVFTITKWEKNRDKYFETINFSTENEFRSFKQLTSTKKLVLKKGFDSTLDFFKPPLILGPVISERLKDAFVSNNITGIELTELDETRLQIQS